MAGLDLSRLSTVKANKVTMDATRAEIARQLELMRRANEKGDLTALDAARTAITSARSTDIRT